MGDEIRKYFGSDLELPMEERSNSTDDELRFHKPLRPHSIHSNVELAAWKRRSIFSFHRPASSPGSFPDLDWIRPPGGVFHSRAEEEDDATIKNRIDVWISRLDQLIFDSSQTDRLPQGGFSSQETLTLGSGSSSSSETTEGGEEGWRDVSPCPSLDEVLQSTVCHSTFGSKECLMTRNVAEKPCRLQAASESFDQDHGTMIKEHIEEEEERSLIKYRLGENHSDIFKACEVLSTRHKLKDVEVRRPIITWSKWNVSQIVRGPHDKSPIWNPSLQRRNWDRPDSIVFRELNKEITRRNDELEKIVRRKTESQQYITARKTHPCVPPSSHLPSSSPSSPSHPFSPKSSVLPPANAIPAEIPPTLLPVISPAITPSCSIIQEVSPQMSSRSDLEAHPCATMPLESVVASGSEPSPSSTGFGLLRRMVKSFWNVFVGDRSCRGEQSRSGKTS